MSPDVRQGGRTGWLACVVVAAVSTGSCDEQPEIIVKRIETKSETIQGPGALSEVGDYLLANRQIRVVVQNEDFSRGFGIYGGSLIDADLQRSSSLTGGEGYDNFSELFPGLFLKAMRPTSIRTTRNDDGSASVIVEGAADEFLFLASRVNDLLLDGPAILFTNEYRLSPGNRYVEIITTITNASPDRQPIEFPTAAARTLLGDTPFIFPGGDVILFGKGNDVFAPGVGFDLLLGQTEALQNPAPPPALPGLVTPLLATRGRRVSYGFLSGETTMDGSLIGQTNTPGGLGDLVVPFVASSFTGAYYAALPARLEVGQTFSFKKYFIVGDGDVASIRDEAFTIRGESTAPVTGRVLDEGASSPESGAEIVVFDAQGRPYNHHRTDAGGRFRGRYPPGAYRYVVLADGRYPTAVESFEVDEQTGASLDVRLPSPGTVTVRITDAQGRTMPGRCALVGTYAMPMGTASGRTFLYDPTIGERARTVDSVPDTDDPTTRRFVEEVIVAANGIATERVRPGRYRAYCSRGIEWSVYEQTVIVADGATAGIDALLQPQMNTSGWASADFHLHAVNSVDSSMSLPRRVAAVAAEGVDLAVSSDHNFITDYTQAIADQDLERYVQSMVGMELTTLEAGHFNAFPLIFDAEPVTNGAFAWPGLTPQALFDALRDRGQLGRAQTVVQVNHPRDSILGYFDNYNFNQDTVEPEDDNGFLARTQEEFRASAFSFDFDAIEVFNGSRVELLRNQRVPNQLPPGVTFEQVGPPGSVYRTEDGEIGFPGGMDDWFALLNRGRLYTATGNSDSHGPEDEPGTPRTFVPVTDDRPGQIDPREVVQALKTGRALVTTGPFVTVEVDSLAPCVEVRTDRTLSHQACGMGELAQVDRTTRLRIEVQAPSWQTVDTVRITVNSATVAVIRDAAISTLERDLVIEEDSWVVVEVLGSSSLFPMVQRDEDFDVAVTDALESVVGAFGLDGLLSSGLLPPPEKTELLPYAFTNPVFIDADGDGRYSGRLRSARQSRARSPRALSRQRARRSKPTMVKLFEAFGHQH